MHTLQYGATTIEYRLDFARRKTLTIDVRPDLSVWVKAPDGTDQPIIEARLKRRAPWILRQQRKFQKYLPHVPPREYVSGETHRYLGRQYRLRVQEGPAEEVKLTRGYFFVTVRDKTGPERVRTLLTEWYRTQAHRIFTEELAACMEHTRFLNLENPEIEIRQMETRWGSCTAEGKILLNLKLVQVPKSYIDYVIIHELCHLKEHNHSARFYALLDRVMPNWRVKREELNALEVA